MSLEEFYLSFKISDGLLHKEKIINSVSEDLETTQWLLDSWLEEK